MKKILTIFLGTSILYGVGMYILIGNLEKGIISGLLFGVLMTAILGIADYISIKKIGGNPGSTTVKQEKAFEMPLSSKNAFELCKKSISSVIDAKIINEDFSKGTIHVKTGISLCSFGENIMFRVQAVDGEKSLVHIQSKPVVPTTLIDYGKNLKNIKTISRFLEENN